MKKYYLKNRCVVCSDLCCITSLRCRKCQDKKHSRDMLGNKNPFFGKKHSIETLKFLKERPKLTGKNHPLFGKHLSDEAKRKISIAKTGKVLSEETRQKMSKAKKGLFSGKKNPMFGKRGKLSPRFGILVSWFRCKYGDVNFRSSYEANFAKWCDGSGITWKYEPEHFDLGNTTYTPDFYLPEFDCWIEVKGYLTDLADKKIKLFKHQYPDINFFMFDKNKLVDLSII